MDTHITMHGNLVADPTQRTVKSGLKVTNFRIASSGRRFDKAADQWVNGDPVFMNVSCWRQLGEHVLSCLRKGDSVVVMGRMTFREYDDKNGGSRRTAYEIEASAVGPDLARFGVTVDRQSRSVPTQPADSAAERVADQAGQPANPWGEPGPSPDEVAA